MGSDLKSETYVANAGRATAAVPIDGLSFLLTVLTLGVWRFFCVPQGYVVIVEAFGRYVRTAVPGLRGCLSFWGLFRRPRMVLPKLEQITHYQETVFSSDAISVNLKMMLGYRVTDPFKAVYEVDNYQDAITNLVRAVMRNECGRRSARNLLSARQEIGNAIEQTLAKDCGSWGIEVLRVEIEDIELGSGNGGKR